LIAANGKFTAIFIPFVVFLLRPELLSPCRRLKIEKMEFIVG
jgi:hypothetical protein